MTPPDALESRGRRLSPVLAGLLFFAAAGQAGAGESVPLPRPRPFAAGAPIRLGPAPHVVSAAAVATHTPETKREPAAAPSGPSACQERLSPQLAVIVPLPPIAGPGECRVVDAVRLEAIILKDDKRVALNPPATLGCAMAEAVTNWMRDEAAPLAAELGAPVAALAVEASFDCRSRNHVAGAKLSEHGLGNALDISGVTLADGRALGFTDIAASKDLRTRLRASACGRFTTVLGPGSDGYHEKHIHLDVAERHGGYRICEWAVWDPSDLPPPLPRARPAEAPPREVDGEADAADQLSR
jgi:hypothetical protein